jgi:hypothetical protein
MLYKAPPSSRGPGRNPFKVETGVRIPLGAPSQPSSGLDGSLTRQAGVESPKGSNLSRVLHSIPLDPPRLTRTSRRRVDRQKQHGDPRRAQESNAECVLSRRPTTSSFNRHHCRQDQHPARIPKPTQKDLKSYWRLPRNAVHFSAEVSPPITQHARISPSAMNAYSRMKEAHGKR